MTFVAGKMKHEDQATEQNPSPTFLSSGSRHMNNFLLPEETHLHIFTCKLRYTKPQLLPISFFIIKHH